MIKSKNYQVHIYHYHNILINGVMKNAVDFVEVEKTQSLIKAKKLATCGDYSEITKNGVLITKNYKK